MSTDRTILSYPKTIRSITITKTLFCFSALYYYHHHHYSTTYTTTRVRPLALASLARSIPNPLLQRRRHRTAPWPLPDTKVAAAKEEEAEEGRERSRCLFKIPLGVRRVRRSVCVVLPFLVYSSSIFLPSLSLAACAACAALPIEKMVRMMTVMQSDGRRPSTLLTSHESLRVVRPVRWCFPLLR